MPWCQTKHITKFVKDLQIGQTKLLEDGITISDEAMMQHYMEKTYLCGLFTMEQMNHWDDYSEADRTVIETTTYFKKIAKCIDKYEKNSESGESKHGFEGVANVQERKSQQYLGDNHEKDGACR